MTTLLFRRGLAAFAGLALAGGLFAQAPKINFPAASPAATLN
jgi:hypothetical protein